MPMRPHAPALLFVVALVSACGDDGGLTWHIAFESPEIASRAAVVEVRVLAGGCGGEDVRYSELVTRDGQASTLPGSLPRGTYGLAGRARDSTCLWYATGCETVELPPDGPEEVVLTLRGEPESPACPALTCHLGECREDAIAQIAAARAHTCVLTGDGRAFCWGRNREGQLGNGAILEISPPVQVAGLGDAVAITGSGSFAGDWSSHTCALRAGGSAMCWGYGLLGRLGNGEERDHSTPVDVLGISSAAALDAGGGHTCARLDSGELRCWGANDSGQLGDGSTNHASVPVGVGTLRVAQLSAGTRHTCARAMTGTIVCWGANDHGQLGIGTTDEVHAPGRELRVSERSPLDISAGEAHTCAVADTGSVWCWGSNATGQIGVSGTEDHPAPIEVPGVTDAVQVGTGYGHTCTRLRSGEVVCWGRNSHFQSGSADGGERVAIPHSVVLDAQALSVGSDHACVIRTTGEVACWGRNEWGRLGDGTTTDSPAPVAVRGLEP